MNKLAVFIVLILLVTACKQVDNKKSTTASDTTGWSGSAVTEQLRDVYHRFPTPEEMLAIIDVKNLVYNPYLMNNPDKGQQYFDSRAQALNLGVYVADLAYLSLFEQHNEAIRYFEVIYELSDKLRISSAFDRALLGRIQDNLTNSDSLKVISEEAFVSLSDYLESNDNEKVFAILSIGGFVEALYLSFSLAGDFHPDNPIVQQIADQKFVLENILEYSALYSDDKNVSITMEELAAIRSVYNELITEKVETKVSRDNSGKLIIAGGDKLKMSEEQYNRLKAATLNTRKKITQK
jgi:hypothetical protein